MSGGSITASQRAPQMAHITYGSYGHIASLGKACGAALEARKASKNILVYARREPVDAMRQSGENKVASTLARGRGVNI